MSNVIRFQKPPDPIIKACLTCKFRVDDPDLPKDVRFWKCGISGFYCRTESLPGPVNCGPEKRLWEQRPPDPPSFLKRLGDAIIERVRGKS